MNEGLVERFARNRSAHCNSPAPQAGVWLLPQRLNTAVSGYFDSAQKPAQAGAWADRQEIPTSDEILDLPSGDASSSEVVELTPNQPEGAWESKGESRESAGQARPSLSSCTQTRIWERTTNSSAKMPCVRSGRQSLKFA